MRVKAAGKRAKKRDSCARVAEMTKFQKGSTGYDALRYPTRMDLRRLYRDEGYPEKEAIRMAQSVYTAIRDLNRREIYLWSKVRETEACYGRGVDGCANRRGILSVGIERPTRPRHYERLRGKRLTLTPEEKTARAEERRTQQARRQEELWEERFLQLARRYEELTSEIERAKERGPTATSVACP